MKLKEMADFLDVKIQGPQNIEIKNIVYDSRKVQAGDLFCCLVGVKTDGHNYVEKAIAKGAVAILAEKELNLPENISLLQYPNSRKALALLAALWYDFPDQDLRMVGITGTNGKTTITNMVKWIWESEGIKTGLIGTIKNMAGQESLPTDQTTPEPLELTKVIKEMKDKQCENIIMEVSSHALKQERVAGIHFDGAVFTNLTQDHLDYHDDFADYQNSKTMLFKKLGEKIKGQKSKNKNKYAIINIDDKAHKAFINATPASAKIDTYAINEKSTLHATEYHLTPEGTEFTLLYEDKEYVVDIPLTGKFNVYNALAAIGIALEEGININAIIRHLKILPQVPGRFELIHEGQNFTVIVDYAHTPDSLENVLNTAKDLKPNRIITVFGCGGDRDAGKRPLMGAIAAEHSQISIVTSDNPRTEDPKTIIDAIIPGVEKGLKKSQGEYIVEPDRYIAIAKAIEIAHPGDLIMIAGKGHEDYQIIGDKKIDFDDRLVARELIREKN